MVTCQPALDRAPCAPLPGATFEAGARYLGALASSRGLLVALEDLHWADATSLSLVPFVARALRGWPVALLVAMSSKDAINRQRNNVPLLVRPRLPNRWPTTRGTRERTG